MAETIKGINVVIGAETTGLSKALTDVNKKSKDIQSELRQVERLLKLDPGNTELLAQKQKLLSDAVGNTSEKLNRLRSVQQQVNEAFANGEISEGQYRAFQREIAKTEQELQGFEGKLSSTGNELDTFANKAQQAGEKVSSVGENLKSTGEKMTKTMGAAALGIGASLGLAVKSAADFDTSMRKAGAIAGATAEELDAMKAAALDLGATTSLSASEVADAMTEMAAKGFSANETIAAMPGVIAAAEASGESLALAADTVSSALNIWGLEAAESARVADVLAMSANVSAAGIDDLGYVLKYAGGPAAALGVSLEEVAAAAGIMTNAGLDGSNAGTALRASLLALNNPAKAQAEMMEELGVSMRDSEGNALSLSEMVSELTKATADMTEADKVATLAKLVGTEAVSGFLSLMSAGPDEIEKMTKALEDSGGASVEAASQMKAGIGGAFENLSGAIDSFVITVGDQLVPIVQKVAEMITALVNRFTALPDPVKKFLVIGTALVGVLAGIGAVIGVVLMAVGSIMTTLGPIIASLGGMTGIVTALKAAFVAVTGPIGIAVAAIAALVAGLTYLYNNNETVRNALTTAWEYIKSVAETVFNAIAEVIRYVFDGIKAFWDQWGGAITQTFKILWEGTITAVKAYLNIYIQAIKAVFNAIKAFWDKWGDTITTIFKNLFEIVKTIFKTAFDLVYTVVKTIFDNLKAFWDRWGDTITTVFKTVLAVVKSVFEGTWNAIKIVVETVIGVISGIVKTWLSIFKGDWAGAWNNAKAVVTTVWDGIKNLFKNSFETMKNIGKDIIRGLIEGIKDMKDAAVNTAKEVASNVANSVKDFFGIKSPSRLMIGYGDNIVQGLANGMKSNAGNAVRSAAGVANAVAGAMSNISGSVAGVQGAAAVAGGNNTVINMTGMMSGANFYVRNDNDINLIAQHLGSVVERKMRGLGG